jgi:small subunit ribosomal protein S17
MEQRGSKKRLVGTVLSDKMDKTVVVQVERLVRHRRYGKVLRRVKKYKVHDEGNECHVGDKVRIVESRPISHEKRWIVEELLRRSEAVAEMPQMEVEP